MALFGSYARGEQKKTSDIDFWIDKGEIKGYFRLAGFQRELEENLLVPVDVLTTGALSDEFLERIKNEEIIIYERNQ
ncbi:MAG: nucleotidyltransferase domain-containing protein [Oscillospiraceae bacterium]|nr:nucleotidyltransferase domain-containing protein [Oscillospiraceae bacterium]